MYFLDTVFVLSIYSMIYPSDDDAIGNLYYNNGYLFYSLEPVEVNIVGDSIDLEMRIYTSAGTDYSGGKAGNMEAD